MCGICGLVAPVGHEPDRRDVDAMLDRIRHRGPDDGASTPLGRCVLGHRRLTIIDLDTGHQPVTDESGGIVAVFNGEIYNFRELRAELAEAGHTVRGTGDTPVIPHLYERHGPNFVERLHGMFALALWDAPRGRLVLARDRVGKKPLLWTRFADGTLAFASELKALLALPSVPRELDLAALDAYLALQYVPGPESALRGVRKLPPGHLLVAEGGDVTIEPYWTLEPRPEPEVDDEEWLERIRAALREAVRKRLVADVPLGALLSGGIDSSIVVALMAQLQTEPVRTFSIGFADARYDERRFARAVADRYGTRHEELVVEPDAAALLPRLAAAYDEPFGDSSALPTYLVSEIARRSVTVALAGDGGDEAFGGYERYRAIALAATIDRATPRPLLRAGAAAARVLPGGRTEPRAAAFRAARFLETAATPPQDRYLRLMEVFTPSLRAALWTPDALAEIDVQRADSALDLSTSPSLTALQLLDVATYLPGDLLFKVDIASMAHSLEVRAPFLDHEVLALGVSLPDRLKASATRGKIGLRAAFAADLPPEVLNRGKRGFGVPLARWFREELRDVAHDALLGAEASARGLFRRDTVERLLDDHAAGRADHGARLWSLLMLELWQRHHVDVPTAALAATP